MDAWGLTDSPFGLEKFALSVVEAVAGHRRGGEAPVGLLRAARLGRDRRAGEGDRESRARGALVLLDVKRGDIGTTAQAYADAYLVPSSPLAVDAITVSPFLGMGSLDPVIDTALRHDAGVFVLALTSNPEGPQFQSATTADGRTVAGIVLDAVATRNAGAEGLGSIGAVVGATIGETSEFLDVNGPLLVPGVGAQGGTVDDVRRIFGGAIRNVLPSTSREVLEAGPEKAALHDAAARAAEQFADLVGPTV